MAQAPGQPGVSGRAPVVCLAAAPGMGEHCGGTASDEGGRAAGEPAPGERARRHIRLLLVEDCADDARLEVRAMERGGYEIKHRRVASLDALEEALQIGSWDLVLLEFTVPMVDFWEVLALLQRLGVGVPVVVVSSAMSQASAASAIRAGVREVVAKDDLSILPGAAERVLSAPLCRGRVMAEATQLRPSGIGDSVAIGTSSEALARSLVSVTKVPLVPLGGERLGRALAEDEHVREILDATFDGTVITDASGVIYLFGAAAATMFGYSKEEAVGRDVSMLMRAQDADAHPLWMDSHSRDGSPSALGEEREMVAERKGGSVFPIALRTKPFRGGFIMAMVDLTERRRLAEEREKLREAGQLAQRMKLVEALANGVVRDLNNLLSPLLCSASILEKDAVDDDTQRQLLEGIREAAQGGARLVRKLRVFADGDGRPHRLVHLQPLIREALRPIEASLPPAIACEWVFPDGPAYVRGDAGQLHGAVLALIENGIEAMAERAGKLTITVAQEILSAPEARRLGVSTCSFVTVAVSDTGHGIAPHWFAKVFEPFFTTKSGGAGVGMGLTNVYGVALRHHGAVAVESELGTGSTFTIYLQASAGGLRRDSGAGGRPEISGVLRLQVLLIEGNDLVRRATARALRARGIDIFEFACASEALPWLRDAAELPDVALIDSVGADAGGQTTVEQLARVMPALPVVLHTSYPRAEDVPADFREGFAEILCKPQLPIVLAGTLRQAALSGALGLSSLEEV